jgi:ubiquinone/menaquinone biosynthesis C-methylase UbiE
MTEQHAKPSEDQILFLERQEISVEDFESSGFILDIGGGGEGIIGRLKKERVVAIDTLESELKEAAPGPLKIIMDARELKFLDQTFPTVTAFFSLMFVREEKDLQKIFSEAFRILTPGGKFLIWDVISPEAQADEKKIGFVIRLLVRLPGGEEVRTGYGQYWHPQKRTPEYYCRLAVAAGFRCIERSTRGEIFELELSKPGE